MSRPGQRLLCLFGAKLEAAAKAPPLDILLFSSSPHALIILGPFSIVQEELLGEGCEFLREALASIPEQEKRQLQKASQAAFVTPVASPLGSMHGLQIPSPTRSVSAGDTTNADAMRLTLRWQVKVVRMPLRAGAFLLACPSDASVGMSCNMLVISPRPYLPLPRLT